MRRREFFVVAAWPRGAWAQQSNTCGGLLLTTGAESDPEVQRWAAAFRKGLEELGWIEGRNVQIDYSSVGGEVYRLFKLVKELVELSPGVILATTGPATTAARQQS